MIIQQWIAVGVIPDGLVAYPMYSAMIPVPLYMILAITQVIQLLKTKMSKKMALPGCDNCADTACPLKSCSRCKLVKYCGKPCQRQHWKSGHNKRCVAVADRKPFAAAEDASVLKCVICLDALQEGVVCLQDDDEYYDKHAIVKIKCGHRFHYHCALEAARESTACVICRADILSSEDSIQRMNYKLCLMFERFLEPNVQVAGALSAAKRKIGALATVVEKEVLEITDATKNEAFALAYFLFNIWTLTE